MTYDNELTLIGAAEYIKDDDGNQIPTFLEVTILCAIKDISQTEFYEAAQSDLQPTIKFIVHAYEYEGQMIVRFKGSEYSVIRTYKPNFEDVELTCERKGSNVIS